MGLIFALPKKVPEVGHRTGAPEVERGLLRRRDLRRIQTRELDLHQQANPAAPSVLFCRLEVKSNVLSEAGSHHRSRLRARVEEELE